MTWVYPGKQRIVICVLRDPDGDGSRRPFPSIVVLGTLSTKMEAVSLDAVKLCHLH